MADMPDFFERLHDDLPAQFRGKPKIKALLRAFARQLDELQAVFYQLKILRWLQTAQGAQLDGIGDIAALSRGEAAAIAESAFLNVPMDDDMYRLYLAWKIAVNTTDCTHTDVRNALRLFWPHSLIYSEDPEYPATAIYSSPDLLPEHNAWTLFYAPKVKAAGVALRIIATTTTPDIGYDEIGVAGAVFGGAMQTTVPPWLPDGIHDKDINIASIATQSIQVTELREINIETLEG